MKFNHRDVDFENIRHFQRALVRCRVPGGYNQGYRLFSQRTHEMGDSLGQRSTGRRFASEVEEFVADSNKVVTVATISQTGNGTTNPERG